MTHDELDNLWKKSQEYDKLSKELQARKVEQINKSSNVPFKTAVVGVLLTCVFSYFYFAPSNSIATIFLMLFSTATALIWALIGCFIIAPMIGNKGIEEAENNMKTAEKEFKKKNIQNIRN